MNQKKKDWPVEVKGECKNTWRCKKVCKWLRMRDMKTIGS